MTTDPGNPAPLLPYANPLPLAGLGELFRDGPLLVARDGTTLIGLCVVCGEPADDNIVRLKFSWDPSFHVTHTSTLQLRKPGAVHARLCPRHYKQWRKGRITGILGISASALFMLASVLTAIVSESSNVPHFAPYAIATLMLGFALFIGFLFLFTLKSRILRCRRIEQGYLYLEGAPDAFLDRLPPLPHDNPGN